MTPGMLVLGEPQVGDGCVRRENAGPGASVSLCNCHLGRGGGRGQGAGKSAQASWLLSWRGPKAGERKGGTRDRERLSGAVCVSTRVCVSVRESVCVCVRARVSARRRAGGGGPDRGALSSAPYRLVFFPSY